MSTVICKHRPNRDTYRSASTTFSFLSEEFVCNSFFNNTYNRGTNKSIISNIHSFSFAVASIDSPVASISLCPLSPFGLLCIHVERGNDPALCHLCPSSASASAAWCYLYLSCIVVCLRWWLLLLSLSLSVCVLRFRSGRLAN